MGLFGRKNVETRAEKPEKASPAEYQPPASHPVHESPGQAQRIRQPRQPQMPALAKSSGTEPIQSFAPIFVKLSRYKEILDDISYLKSSISLARNQIQVLNELSRLHSQNLAGLQTAVERLSTIVSKIDSDFLRPAGLGGKSLNESIRSVGGGEPEPGMRGGEAVARGEDAEEVEGLQQTLAALRQQIDSLKQDMGMDA